MKTSVLLNLVRIVEVAFAGTFERDEEGVMKWNERCNYAYKFVVLPDETLVIAPMLDHIALYATYITMELSIEEAKEQIEVIGKNPDRRDLVIGAGVISAAGKVINWESTGFTVETPQSMRDQIQETVTRLHGSGELPGLLM